jgi:hypothetical protein
LIYESRVKIKFMGQKYFTKKNYKVVIIMWFLLYQIIVSKIFLVDALLDSGHLLDS